MAISPYQMMLSQRYAQPEPVPVMGSGAPEDAILRARRMLQETLAGARQGVDPRIAEILDRRAQRIDTREQELAKFEKPNVADTLTRIGTALMANQSPFFGVALGNALNQNMQAEQARRMEAIRRRMSLDEQRDELDMERINQEGAGRKEAMAELNTVLSLAKNIGGIEGDQLEAQARRIALENAPAEAAAKLELLKVQIFQTRTAAQENLAQAAAAGRSNRGGGGGASDVEARADRSELDKAAARYNAARAVYNRALRSSGGMASGVPEEVAAKMEEERANLETLNRAFYRRYGSSQYGLGLQRSPAIVTPGPANLQDPLGIRSQR